MYKFSAPMSVCMQFKQGLMTCTTIFSLYNTKIIKLFIINEYLIYIADGYMFKHSHACSSSWAFWMVCFQTNSIHYIVLSQASSHTTPVSSPWYKSFFLPLYVIFIIISLEKWHYTTQIFYSVRILLIPRPPAPLSPSLSPLPPVLSLASSCW